MESLLFKATFEREKKEERRRKKHGSHHGGRRRASGEEECPELIEPLRTLSSCPPRVEESVVLALRANTTSVTATIRTSAGETTATPRYPPIIRDDKVEFSC